MSRLRANLLLGLAALIWGAAFVGQVLGMDSVGPLAFTALRFALGALVVAPLAWRESRQAAVQGGGSTPRAEAGTLIGLGLLLTAGVNLQQIGLQSTSVTHAGFLTALYMPLVPLLGWLLQRRAPHPGVWAAVAVCLLGTWLLTGGGAAAASAGNGPAAAPWNIGDAWVLASALPWALHVLWVGGVANRLRGAYRLALAQFVVCALASALLAWAAGESLHADGVARAAGALAFTGVLSVGVAYTLQVVGQRHAPPADAAIVMSAETVFAAGFGAWLLGDRLTPGALAGAALILVGILLNQWLPLARARASPRPRWPSTARHQPGASAGSPHDT